VVAREFLEEFMKHNKDFDILLKAELDVAPPNTHNIDSTELGIPKGEWYQSINNTLQDTNYLPITENRWVIKKKFIKRSTLKSAFRNT
jgi:hypothetical protein